MQWIQRKTEPMHIFIEGGAGVGKTKVARAIHESMNRFYRTQPGTDPDKELEWLHIRLKKIQFIVDCTYLHSKENFPL